MVHELQPQKAIPWSERGFWSKLRRFALGAGREVVEKALWLYYAARRPDCPVWARATAVAALGYFISMIDAIPDITPVLGYTDDLGVMALAVATLAAYVNDEVRRQTDATLSRFFPSEPDDSGQTPNE